MNKTAPFLIHDLDRLRERVFERECSNDRNLQDGRLWTLIKNCARTAPDQFPWFTPFVALMTEDAEDIRRAKKVLLDYIAKLEPMSFSSGLQYHFWCFAFPHAKWSMYFQWLCTLGAFSEDEEKAIRETLVSYHFTNFFFGLRTKPEPECIDNQTLSLSLSTVMVGYLFASGEKPSKMAEKMLEEGLRRLPGIIGGIPSSGYTGEGSSYMDCVIGPAIPLVIELLDLLTGERDLFWKPFAPNDITPEQILRMTAREWMPGGLLLPWDNYGYQYGVRAPIAYALRQTGDELYKRILLKDAVWSYDIGVGWAYDDLVWSLIWWPEDEKLEQDVSFDWFEPDVGGVLTAQGNDFYLMQMWDESEPVIPTRSHVNPNAVLLHAYGVPLTLDGAIVNSPRFQFADTWRETVHSVGEITRYNYGDGCGGAHSILLVDGWEGLRAKASYAQHFPLRPEEPQAGIGADVTALYRERFADAVQVRRRSSVGADRFFIIEDLAMFGGEHTFTSRFVLRPGAVDTELGFKIRTPEGVTLHLIELSGQTKVQSESIQGAIYYYPMDSETLLVDFDGESGSRLFIAFMSRSFQAGAAEADWRVILDPSESLDVEEARIMLAASEDVVPFQLPAYMERSLPIAKRWWYSKTVRKRPGQAWLQLPRGMHDPKCWIDGHEIELAGSQSLLLAPTIAVPRHLENREQVEVVIRCDVPVSHYEGKGDGTIGLNGGVAVCYPCEEEVVLGASFDGAQMTVTTNEKTYRWPYKRMGE
ncbi:hypothetical protein [Paenibacillus silvisoli]|uniref:hypothetical protein n=1 Tax=Paenibacillus silvisoli TaxID=3110539 RepID=UPI0028049AD5|nr:hypothetical protein [Paenibacillus silvisoli]